MTDFSKFRESGDLSDITVAVGSKEHRLHKFPLYARSDFFCELARSNPGSDAEPFKVELNNFPGGNDVFGQVANFCYNMPLDLNKNNVVAIRCAAEYLKMSGPGNLKEISRKFLTDTVSSAQTHRLTTVIVSMLMDCNDTGDIAEAAGVLDLCLDALVGCWITPGVKYSTVGTGRALFKVITARSEPSSAFTRIQAPNGYHVSDDETTVKYLLTLRADWVAKLLTKAEIKGISCEELGSIAVKYISSAVDNEPGDETDENRKNELGSKDGAEDYSVSIDNEKDVDTHDSTAGDEHLASTDLLEKNISPAKTPPPLKIKFDIGTVLDTIVSVLPHQAFCIPMVTMEWLTKTIRVATLHNCECRGKLVRVAGEMLTKLDTKDLCLISPSVLHDIIMDASDEKNETSSRLSTDRACNLVDKYMVQMAKDGTLTTESFRLLASATKNYTRTSHDLLYHVLEFVMKTEKDKNTPEQRAELADFVNFDLLSETCLQKALDEDIVPASQIAHSAIKLCARMRSELASVKYIAEMQEDDIQKYQTAVGKVQSTKSSLPSNTESRHFTSFAYRQRNTDSEQDDSIDKSSLDAAKTEDLESLDHYHSTDSLKAAQNALTVARHKLNLPVYTGYRPLLLSRLSPPTYAGSHLYNYHTQREHDISLEEELEFKFDRSFQSLDPRVRHHRLSAHQHRTNIENGQRTYFPYSSHSNRF